MWSIPYFVRCFILYFNYKLNEEKLNKEIEDPWFYNHRHYITLKYTLSALIAAVLSGYVLNIIFQAAYPKLLPYDTLDHCMKTQLIPITIQGVISTISVMYCAWKIYKIKDAFSIKTELVVVTGFAPPLFIIWLILEYLTVAVLEKYILILVVVFVVYIYVTIYPIYKTFEGLRLVQNMEFIKGNNPQFLTKDSENIGEVTINVPTEIIDELTPQQLFFACLDNDTMYKAFQQHCVESFCAENALFYKNAMKFQDLEENTLRKKEIATIVKLYLEEEARLLINIKGSTRVEVLEKSKLEEIPNTILDDAMHEVFAQMYQDTFPKFKNSNGYKKALKKSKIEKSSTVRSNFSARSHKSSKSDSSQTPLNPQKKASTDSTASKTDFLSIPNSPSTQGLRQEEIPLE